MTDPTEFFSWQRQFFFLLILIIKGIKSDREKVTKERLKGISNASHSLFRLTKTLIPAHDCASKEALFGGEPADGFGLFATKSCK